MLELAPRLVDRVQEPITRAGETPLPLREWTVAPLPLEHAPVQGERDVRLAALAAGADPSYVRVFRPAPPPAGDEPCTGFDMIFWSLMAVLVGILGLTMIGGTVVACALTVWRVP